MCDVIGHAKKHSIVAQQWQKYYANEKRQEISYEMD
jgi:hypothetical protein